MSEITPAFNLSPVPDVRGLALGAGTEGLTGTPLGWGSTTYTHQNVGITAGEGALGADVAATPKVAAGLAQLTEYFGVIPLEARFCPGTQDQLKTSASYCAYFVIECSQRSTTTWLLA